MKEMEIMTALSFEMGVQGLEQQGPIYYHPETGLTGIFKDLGSGRVLKLSLSEVISEKEVEPNLHPTFQRIIDNLGWG